MARIEVSHAAVLDAPAPAVYAVIADYRVGHPSILPTRAFHDLTVEEGGVGAGTVIRFAVRMMGVDRWMRARITEPEPGRVLVESGLDGNDTVTTFTVDAVDGGRRAAVRFDTVWTERGVAGWVQKLVAPPLMRKLYAEEQANLEQVAREQAERERA